MTNITKTSLLAGAAGSIVQLAELGRNPGDLVHISEPLNPLQLTAGTWPEFFREISPHISDNPGTYLLVGAEQHGEHPVYVGEAGNVLSRLRTHAFPKKVSVVWFAVLSSKWPVLSKTQVRGIEAGIYRALEPIDGIRLIGCAPPIFPMSAADSAAVDGGLATLKRLLGYAGFPIDARFDAEDAVLDGSDDDDDGEGDVLPRLYRSYRFTPGPNTIYADLHAIGSDLDDGFMIHAGADYRPAISHALSSSIMARRRRLETGDFLEPIPGVSGRLRLKRPVTVTSGLVAAKVLAGYAVNDPRVWRPLDGAPVEIG